MSLNELRGESSLVLPTRDGLASHRRRQTASGADQTLPLSSQLHLIFYFTSLTEDIHRSQEERSVRRHELTPFIRLMFYVKGITRLVVRGWQGRGHADPRTRPTTNPRLGTPFIEH